MGILVALEINHVISKYEVLGNGEKYKTYNKLNISRPMNSILNINRTSSISSNRTPTLLVGREVPYCVCVGVVGEDLGDCWAVFPGFCVRGFGDLGAGGWELHGRYVR